ncbi:hypothetical protein CRUP_002883 [Coryphaenoides rupestris]|nr:hypothetical protein CRUP_002883 [Coryphaenoides rupestris]
MAATLDHKSPNVLLQSLCCRITGKSEAEVAHQFQYAVRVIGSNYAPTIERDEFLQRRPGDAALFSELHRKLQTQGFLKHSWSVLHLLHSLCEDPRKPSPRLGSYGALFAQALPRDAHSTPFYCTRPQSLALSYGERLAAGGPPGGAAAGGLSATTLGTSGVSSLGVYTLNWPSPTPQSLLAGQPPPAAGGGGQPPGSRLAWALPVGPSPSCALAPPPSRPPLGPVAVNRSARPRREGDPNAEVTEALLVRDLLYVFQGIDGKYIKMSLAENSYKMDAKVVLSKSLRDTSSRLAELGWLHNKGEWGVTAQQEAEEAQRVRQFQDTVPKMHSKLHILTDSYQQEAEEAQRVRQFQDTVPKMHSKLHILTDSYQLREGGGVSCILLMCSTSV